MPESSSSSLPSTVSMMALLIVIVRDYIEEIISCAQNFELLPLGPEIVMVTFDGDTDQ